MAISEINDRDAEQIGGGFVPGIGYGALNQFMATNTGLFAAPASAPRIGLMRSVSGSATGGAYTSSMIRPSSTRVRYHQRLGISRYRV